LLYHICSTDLLFLLIFVFTLSHSKMTSPPTSPSKMSLAEEPLLPTYEQFDSTDPATSDSPPESTATADQIRDFVVHLLTTKRGLALDHARRIASKWTIGNGKELRSWPPSMYLDIFGREDGWVVYKEVKLCIAHDEQSKKPSTSLASKCKCSPSRTARRISRVPSHHAKLTTSRSGFPTDLSSGFRWSDIRPCTRHRGR